MTTRLATIASEAGRRVALVLDDGSALDGPAAAQAAGLDPAPLNDMVSTIAAWDSLGPMLRAAAAKPPPGATVAAGAYRLLAPIPRPAKNVFCVGRNYIEHVAEGDRAAGRETETPKYPQFFTKPPTAVIGTEETVPSYAAITRVLDYEVELAVVIGRPGSDIPAERAFEHVFGYTVANDITARDLQRRHGQWFKGKGLDRSCPLGPWIVPADEIAAPPDLRISLTVNGELRQDSRTSQLIFDLPTIIATLSQGLTFETGDVIATGTPSGVGYAMTPPRVLGPGDVIEATIEGIGTLVTRIVA
ncbi:fumarylacetoacetate hydrolase family protein [Elioraea rosea]|uniref:fumarylacetoacetate hydrolase family protein n=1 Tax=Elioraea rosea TaxID=2492390 RepID=UPI001185B224|nr:fumarylacetoacetate hydrolase family protein [Elioraea rosea]